MALKRRTADEVVAAVVESLGFDGDAADLTTPEAAAALVRRAASFVCPTSPQSLEQAVAEAAFGLIGDPAAFDISGVIELLTAYGDFVEARVEREDSIRTRRVLFLARPSFVAINSSTAVLLGVAPAGLTLIDDALRSHVLTDGCVRRVRVKGGTDVAEWLSALGLHQMSSENWLNSPKRCEASELVAQYDALLSSSLPAGDSGAGARILDPNAPTSFYRGRWRLPKSKDSGRFVFRIPVRFGSDAWGYGQFDNGNLGAFIALPLGATGVRGCDDAWRLQAAIDETRGNAQRLRVRKLNPETSVIELLGPLPGWAQRRLDSVGSQVVAKGALVAYSVDTSIVTSELEFLAAMMWTLAED